MTFDYVIFNQGRLLLISQQDADQFKNHPGLFSLKSQVFLNESSRTISDEERPLLVKAKFLGGFSRYTIEEKSLLDGWLQQQTPGVSRTFFEDKVLACFPNKKRAYAKGGWLSTKLNS